MPVDSRVRLDGHGRKVRDTAAYPRGFLPMTTDDTFASLGSDDTKTRENDGADRLVEEVGQIGLDGGFHRPFGQHAFDHGSSAGTGHLGSPAFEQSHIADPVRLTAAGDETDLIRRQ